MNDFGYVCPECEGELEYAKLIGPHGLIYYCIGCKKFWAESELQSLIKVKVDA